MPQFDQETLMAYADGMLEPAEMAQVATAAATDPGIAAQIAMFKRTAAMASAAVGETTVPAALLARVKSQIAAHEAPRVSFWGRISGAFSRLEFGLPMAGAAASVALVLGGVIGFQLAPGGSGHAHLAIGEAPSPELAEALDKVKSGAAADIASGKFRAVASFRSGDGALCREFEYSGDAAYAALACRESGGWTLRFAVITAAADDGYAPASAVQALEAYLSAAGAGPALSEQEESAALRAD